MSSDPRAALHEGKMTIFQSIVCAICVAVNMVDGFDVLAISFTAPLIAREWGVEPAALGILLSAGLAGMAAGAVFISPIADVMGRRAVVLLSTLMMTVGMLASAVTTNVFELSMCRLVTGLGVGGVLASGNTLLAEYAPRRWRDFVISIMVVGYSAGAIVGGSISAYLIEVYGWRSAFVFGGLCSAVLLPLIHFYLPESLDFILSRRRGDTLGKVNAVLRRLGRPELQSVPVIAREEGTTRTVIGVIEPRYAKGTVLIVLSFFMLMLSFYFVLSWTPKNLVDLGFTVQQGIFASVLLNLGGIVGGLVFGYFASRSGARTLAPYMLGALFVAIVGFGLLRMGLFVVMTGAVIAGFFLIGSMGSLYMIVPQIYPPNIRNTGTGLAIGFGRLGAVVGPALGGILIDAQWDRAAYYSVLALPVLISAFAVRHIPLFDEPAEKRAPVSAEVAAARRQL